MKVIALFAALSLGAAACTAASPTQPAVAAEPSQAVSTSGFTCAGARTQLGVLITYARNSTAPFPATRAALLAPLQRADAALAATPCDKDGATQAMQEFKAAVAANRATITGTQFVVYNRLADSIISYIAQIP